MDQCEWENRYEGGCSYEAQSDRMSGGSGGCNCGPGCNCVARSDGHCRCGHKNSRLLRKQGAAAMSYGNLDPKLYPGVTTAHEPDTDHYCDNDPVTCDPDYHTGDGACPTGTKFVNGCCRPEGSWLQDWTGHGNQRNYIPYKCSERLPPQEQPSSWMSNYRWAWTLPATKTFGGWPRGKVNPTTYQPKDALEEAKRYSHRRLYAAGQGGGGQLMQQCWFWVLLILVVVCILWYAGQKK